MGILKFLLQLRLLTQGCFCANCSAVSVAPLTLWSKNELALLFFDLGGAIQNLNNAQMAPKQYC